MIVRDAQIKDVKRIHELIGSYAGLDRMLFQSLTAIYENLQTFSVAEADGTVVGCCALKILWEDLAEIKSLAVDQSHFGRGVGRALEKETLPMKVWSDCAACPKQDHCDEIAMVSLL